MSRSAFAARFTELVGEPVMSYVARWRMQVAVAALTEEGATVGQLADRLGHRSEAAFSRAFKRVVGVSPGAVRRSAGERDGTLIGYSGGPAVSTASSRLR
jgi:AraC-like DNA-binding protein